MENAVDWWPGKWVLETRGLTPEQKGIYIDLINERFLRGVPLLHDGVALALLCGCSTRKFRLVLEQLVEARKVAIREGQLLLSACGE